MDFKDQAERFGTRVITEEIARVDLTERPFRLWSGAGEEIEARTVIIATGANARWIGLPNEERLAQSGGGVSACAVCDGALPHFRDRVIAVVGGGDSAMEDALYMTKFASEVVVIHRRDELRASRIMQQRAFDNDKIRMAWNTVVTDVVGDDEITALKLKDTATGEERELEVGGLFVAIGHKPNTDLFRGVLDMDDDTGYLVTRPDSTYTNVPGVFACGDVKDSVYRQAITAAGSGCMAAIDAERWLEDVS